MLPREVIQKAQTELLNWNNYGVSAMEISHRSPEFTVFSEESRDRLRALLHVPKNYHVLFMHGGGRGQFAALPMNFLDQHKNVAYAQTGHWGKMAATEAALFATVNVVVNTEQQDFLCIPPQSTWKNCDDAAYLHYVDNETIHGVEFSFIPKISERVPLICDMSSNFLSREFDVSKFGLIYACAQKNAGIAGITIVIVRDDLLQRRVMSTTPSILNYALHAKNNSMVNTPSTYPWYIAGLMFEWLEKQGGIAAIEKINAEKAKRLYDFIDAEPFYTAPVARDCRSRMNVFFKTASAELDTQFIAFAKTKGLIGLKGHKISGGIRASIYNAMPMEGVDQLISVMKQFI